MNCLRFYDSHPELYYFVGAVPTDPKYFRSQCTTLTALPRILPKALTSGLMALKTGKSNKVSWAAKSFGSTFITLNVTGSNSLSAVVLHLAELIAAAFMVIGPSLSELLPVYRQIRKKLTVLVDFNFASKNDPYVVVVNKFFTTFTFQRHRFYIQIVENIFSKVTEICTQTKVFVTDIHSYFNWQKSLLYFYVVLGPTNRSLS